MKSLLFETEQVDPGTVEDSKLDLLQPLAAADLYALWEEQQWAAHALHFESDRRDWAELPGQQRAMILRSMAPFFAVDDGVAAALASLILSANDESESACLATHIVDRERHSRFLERAWCNVFEPDPNARREVVDGARTRHREAFAELFDRKLKQATNRLRTNPRDVAAKVEAVTIYYLVVEGTLGLTSHHFLLDYFRRNAILAGVTEGFRRVKADEHRHVAWASWFLRERCREDAQYGTIVQSTLTELLPSAASILMDGGPGVCDGLDAGEFLDYSCGKLFYFTLLGLSRRLKVIGGATGDIQRFAASGAWRASRLLQSP